MRYGVAPVLLLVIIAILLGVTVHPLLFLILLAVLFLL